MAFALHQHEWATGHPCVPSIPPHLPPHLIPPACHKAPSRRFSLYWMRNLRLPREGKSLSPRDLAAWVWSPTPNGCQVRALAAPFHPLCGAPNQSAERSPRLIDDPRRLSPGRAPLGEAYGWGAWCRAAGLGDANEAALSFSFFPPA